MPATTRITTIGIVTADRPAAVGRALESFARHCDRHGRRPRFLVIDGSRGAASRRATRTVVDTIAAASGHHLEYVGPAEAMRFRRRLTSGTGLAAIAGPGPIGPNRNLFLLLTAGEHALAVDDDIVCDTWAIAGRAGGLAVTGHGFEFLEAAFFPNRAAVLAAGVRTPVDLLAAHEALLARSLAALLEQWSTSADLTLACRHVRASVAAGRPLIVKATFAGVAGDAATYCPYRMLFSSGALRSLLWSSGTIFARAIRTRETFRIASTNVVTHNAGCMAGCMGLSNRDVLPPFMTVGRNEDGVFGVMLAACDPWAMFGHAPVGVVHDSHRPARRAGGRILSATGSRVSDFLLAIVPSLVPSRGTRSPRTRMRRLGEALARVGGLPARDLETLVRDVTLDVRARQWRHAAASVETPGCPDYWRAALDRYRREFNRSVTRRGFFLPIEFRRGGSLGAGYRALGGYLRSFGQLVTDWPDVWDAARALNLERERARALTLRGGRDCR